MNKLVRFLVAAALGAGSARKRTNLFMCVLHASSQFERPTGDGATRYGQRALSPLSMGFNTQRPYVRPKALFFRVGGSEVVPRCVTVLHRWAHRAEAPAMLRRVSRMRLMGLLKKPAFS